MLKVRMVLTARSPRELDDAFKIRFLCVCDYGFFSSIIFRGENNDWKSLMQSAREARRMNLTSGRPDDATNERR